MVDQRIINGIIFLDAAQRYHAELKSGGLTNLSGDQRAALIEQLLRDASRDSPLNEGAEKEVMGEAWARFLKMRSRATVDDFLTRLSSSSLVDAVKEFKVVKDINETYAVNPYGLANSFNPFSLLSLGEQVKRIAQETGMIDYTKEETLVGILRKFSATIRDERGLPPPKPLAEPPLEHMSGLPAHLRVNEKTDTISRA